MVICIAKLQGELNISSENCILKFFYPYNLFFLLQGVRLFILIGLFISPTHDLATMLAFHCYDYMCIINDIVNGIVIQTSCACLYKYLNRFNLLSLPRYGCHELNRNVKCNIIALKGRVLHILPSRIYCNNTNEN